MGALKADEMMEVTTKLMNSVYVSLQANRMDHFTHWISFSLRKKTDTKRLNFGLSPEFKLTNHTQCISLLTP